VLSCEQVVSGLPSPQRLTGTVARLAAAITEQCRQITNDINALETEIKTLAEQLASMLIGIPG